jgi:hypothetical protein
MIKGGSSEKTRFKTNREEEESVEMPGKAVNDWRTLRDIWQRSNKQLIQVDRLILDQGLFRRTRLSRSPIRKRTSSQISTISITFHQ